MTLLLKGAIIMTLRKLMLILDLYISCPPDLGDIKIKNVDDFCRYPLVSYFCSVDFVHDMHTAKLYWDNNSYDGVEFYFCFHRDENENFSLELLSQSP